MIKTFYRAEIIREMLNNLNIQPYFMLNSFFSNAGIIFGLPLRRIKSWN